MSDNMTSAPVPLAEQPTLSDAIAIVQRRVDNWELLFGQDASGDTKRKVAAWRLALATLQQHEQLRARVDELECKEVGYRDNEEWYRLRLQQHERAISERDDLQRTFDLQWEADQRAIKRWQEAHPGNDMVWPDRANMVVWLMEQHAAIAVLEDEEAAHQDTLRLWQEAKAKHERAMAALRKSRQALELIVSIQATAKISRTNENAAFVDWRDLAAASGDAQEALAALDAAANTAQTKTPSAKAGRR